MKTYNIKWIKPSVLVCVGVFALATAARAQSTLSASYSFEGGDWGSSDWSMVGNALYANDGALTPAHRLRLTSNNFYQNGAAWLNTTAVNPTTDWTWTMRGENSFPNGGSIWADETSMILQTAGASANVGTGAFDGSGLGTYVAVVLDNFSSLPNNLVEVYTSSGGLIGSFSVGSYLDRGDYYNCTATYTAATDNLYVDFKSDAGSDITDNFTVDLAALFASDDYATLGFGGSTGADGSNHDIVDTSFTMDVPEPGTLALASLGGLGLLLFRRRKS
jgi:hypothetical protein